MRTATFILSFAIVGLASCSAPRTLIQSSRTDSVGIDRKVDIRTRIEYVPIIVHIPDQRASAIIEPSDTSHLETDYAVSDAFIFNQRSAPHIRTFFPYFSIYFRYRSVK